MTDCTSPIVTLESGSVLKHVLRVGEYRPRACGKRPRDLGVEIWGVLTAIGEPTPTDPAAFRFIALDTRTPFTMEYEAADGGKNAHYLLRWANAAGQRGPWSETATVAV